MQLSIIIPAYNEEQFICRLLEKLDSVSFGSEVEAEIVIVDDGSSDRTRENVEQFLTTHRSSPIRMIRHAENQGKGAAVRTGIESSNGEVILIQDADLEYDPNDINLVIQPILSGESEVVYGSRILKEKEMGRSGALGLFTGKHPDSYLLAYLGGVAITKWVNFLTGSNLTDEPTCYKCMRRECLQGLVIENDDFAWEPELTVKLLNLGFVIKEVPVNYYPRKTTEGKKINWRDGIKALWITWVTCLKVR